MNPATPQDTPFDVDVHDVKQLLDSGALPLLLDCRETQEYELVHLEGATLIPLSEFPGRLVEIDAPRGLVERSSLEYRFSVYTSIHAYDPKTQSPNAGAAHELATRQEAKRKREQEEKMEEAEAKRKKEEDERLGMCLVL